MFGLQSAGPQAEREEGIRLENRKRNWVRELELEPAKTDWDLALFILELNTHTWRRHHRREKEEVGGDGTAAGLRYCLHPLGDPAGK